MCKKKRKWRDSFAVIIALALIISLQAPIYAKGQTVETNGVDMGRSAGTLPIETTHDGGTYVDDDDFNASFEINEDLTLISDTAYPYTGAFSVYGSLNIAGGNIYVPKKIQARYLTISGGIIRTNEILTSFINDSSQFITVDGDAVVFTERIRVNNSEKGPTLTQGVVFVGNAGTVYGTVNLPGSVEIPIGYTLTVPEGAELVIPKGITLTNNGTIQNNGTIKNYGVMAGNVVTGNKVQQYSSVTVTDGTGGGEYKEGEIVTITADAPESGKQFKEWIGVDGLTFTDGTSKTSAIAKFTMPANAVSVTATYEDIPEVVEAPNITGQPADVSVKVGEKATFTVTATGTEPLTYQWMIDRKDGKGFVNISNATASAYTTSAVDKDCDGFKYKCVVSNAAGSAESNMATLTVTEEIYEPVEYKITKGSNQSIEEGYKGAVTITCDGELSKFKQVLVDGKVVDAKFYTVVSGSTILTFTNDYLASLSVGKHTVRFEYSDGYAETNLAIEKAEDKDNDDAQDDCKDNDDKDNNQNDNDETPKTGDT